MSKHGTVQQAPADLEARIEANRKIYEEFFDQEFSLRLVKDIMSHIDKYYFRSRFVGFEDIPSRKDREHPVIFISNHSGMAFPWDAIVFSAGIYKLNDFEFSKTPRALTAPMLSQLNLMNPFLLENFWKRGGGVDATTLNFETMMRYPDSHVLMYPEGVPGIGKGFNNKYVLQRFSSSFIRMSIKYRTEVIPIMTINGEYINPYAYSWNWVNKIAIKLGIPFLPIGWTTLLIPFQPWMFYFGLPAKLTFIKGEPIRPFELTDKPFEELSYDELREIADQVRELMQEQMDRAVAQYGKKPYNLRELFSIWLRNPGKFPFFMPCFWPSLFQEFDRLFKRERGRVIHLNLLAGLRAFIMNPITIAFFIPIFGWIPILLRGYRKKKS